jgi:hypothetical protein
MGFLTFRTSASPGDWPVQSLLSRSVMAAVPGIVVGSRCVASARVGGLGNRYGRGVAQRRCEHQSQRRHDPKGQKCVQRRQDAAQIARHPRRELPNDGGSRKPAQGRDCPSAGRDFKARSAAGTINAIRKRDSFGGGYFSFAVRTHSCSHGTPPGRKFLFERLTIVEFTPLWKVETPECASNLPVRI